MQVDPVPHPRRLSDRARGWFDRGIVVLLAAPAVPYGLLTGDWVYTLLALAQSIPLLLRRRRPVLSFLLVGAASAAQLPLTDQPLYTQLAFPIAVYSLARYSTGWRALAGLAVGLLASIVASFDWMSGFGISLTPYVLSCAAIVIAAWALGTMTRTRAAYVSALIERGERIEREAVQATELAAAAERARIAREMHDVVAHGLTTIIVQADGARYAGSLDQSSVALQTISTTARAALGEVRGTLGVLREGDTGRQPQPGLTAIADLTRQTGTCAEFIGLDRQVPDGLALTAYRVVQEALTNIRRHAGPTATAHVRVEVGDDIRIQVLDDGVGSSAVRTEGGLGLRGMAERVAAHRGELQAGPHPAGFAVRVRLPL